MRSPTVALASLLLCSAALAQAPETISDDPPGANVPDGQDLSVLGIELGMTPEEVEAAYDSDFGEPFVTQDMQMGMTNPANGARFELQFPAQTKQQVDQAARYRDDGRTRKNTVAAFYGSPAVGNRMMGLYRYLYFGSDETPVPTVQFIDQLKDKYGEPSGEYEARNGNTHRALYWVFDENGKVELPEGITFNGLVHSASAPSEPIVCQRAFERVAQRYRGASDTADLDPYNFVENREIDAEDRRCRAGLLVTIGERDGNAELANFFLADGKRMIENAEGLDAVIRRTLLEEPPKPVENAPEL